MDIETDDQRERFLGEYSDLCKKYKMIVSSCDCCDSPFLVSIREKSDKEIIETIDNHTKHLQES